MNLARWSSAQSMSMSFLFVLLASDCSREMCAASPSPWAAPLAGGLTASWAMAGISSSRLLKHSCDTRVIMRESGQ